MNGLKRNGSGYVDPTAYKALTNVQKGNKMEIYRGDIFFVGGSGGNRIGSEQKQDRPAIVVSNDKGNEHSPVVEVVFLTSAEKAKYLPTHVEVLCQIPSVALCEQVHSISKERLSDYIRSCTDAEMKAIDKALMISLGLNKQPKEQVVATSGMIDDLKMKLEGAERALDEEKSFVDSLQRELGELADERDALERKIG